MSARDWHQFNAHHLEHWGGRNASIKAKRKAISAAWKRLNTGATKHAEVQAIRTGQGRTLAQIRASAPAPAPAQVPPPPPPPPPTLALSLVQTTYEKSPDSSPAPPSANMPEQHVPRAEEHEDPVHQGLLDREEIMEEFSPEDPARPGLSRWLGGWKIGGRGANKACVWVCFDDDENVVDRIVIKDVAPKPPVWVDVSRWEGDPRDLTNRIPIECVIHERLCKSGGRAFFVNLLAHRSFTGKQMYRMIFEYCDQTDAKELSKEFDSFTDGIEGGHRPEPFFWRILEHLVLAATVMEQGSLDNPVEGWKQIVHRDLKADNVFMTTDRDCYYPKPLISDFEFAIQTSKEDPWNPAVYRHHRCGESTGAWFCQPLEAMPREEFRRDATKSLFEAYKILSPANVWCIGFTMYTIMHGQHSPKERVWQPDYRDDAWWSWDESVANIYSGTLYDIVDRCLSDDPSHRPTLADLRDYFTSGRLPQDAEECRDARNPRSQSDLRKEDWLYTRPTDDYAVGLSRDEILQGRQERREKEEALHQQARKKWDEQHEQAFRRSKEQERQEELDTMTEGTRQHNGPTTEDEEASGQEEREEGSAQMDGPVADELDLWGEQPNTTRSTPDGPEINDEEETNGRADLDADSASMDISD